MFLDSQHVLKVYLKPSRKNPKISFLPFCSELVRLKIFHLIHNSVKSLRTLTFHIYSCKKKSYKFIFISLSSLFGRLIIIINLTNYLFFTYVFCWLFVDKLLVLLFKCKFSEWPADFSCIMGDLHEKRWRFYFFFLWLTPAEEGSQARSHKITLTEFIRLILDDKHSIYVYITHLSKRSLKSNNIPTNVCQLLERTQQGFINK